MGRSVTRWWSAMKPYEVEYVEPYEPYAILPRDSIPRFDERFRYPWESIC